VTFVDSNNSPAAQETVYTTSSFVVNPSTGDVTINGGLFATTKSFLIDHPTKIGKKLKYGSLEGPENGVYVRGRLVGSTVINLPDYWVELVDFESITVNLTPINYYQTLFVKEIHKNAIIIENGLGSEKDIDCYFIVFAERKDVEKLQVEI
jgi:hypothetical protein